MSSLVLFLKAWTRTVNVKASVRKGKAVKAHTRRINEVYPKPKASKPKEAASGPVPRIGERTSQYSGHRVPSADFEARDLQDSGKRVTAESVLKDYGARKGAIAYQAHVPMQDIPTPMLAEEQAEEQDGDFEDGEGYDWSEYHGRNTFVPVKLRVTPKGETQIIDGNHRLKFFDEANFTHAPAWVIDERANVAGEDADEDDDE